MASPVGTSDTTRNAQAAAAQAGAQTLPATNPAEGKNKTTNGKDAYEGSVAKDKVETSTNGPSKPGAAKSEADSNAAVKGAKAGRSFGSFLRGAYDFLLNNATLVGASAITGAVGIGLAIACIYPAAPIVGGVALLGSLIGGLRAVLDRSDRSAKPKTAEGKTGQATPTGTTGNNGATAGDKPKAEEATGNGTDPKVGATDAAANAKVAEKKATEATQAAAATQAEKSKAS